jgi:IS66 Orf2 like protein
VGVGVIQITPQMRILVAIEAVDGRKGIDSLARLCQEKLQADPFSGCLFVFRSMSGRKGSTAAMPIEDSAIACKIGFSKDEFGRPFWPVAQADPRALL